MGETQLKHYGVPGMKWGVRRDKAKSAKLLAKSKEARKKGNTGKADRLEKKSKSYRQGQKSYKKRMQRRAVAAGLGTAFALNAAVNLSTPEGRQAVKRGVAAVKLMVQLAGVNHLNKKYSRVPPKTIKTGIDFAKKRFGAYNISSM